jgi:hypothetical protein
MGTANGTGTTGQRERDNGTTGTGQRDGQNRTHPLDTAKRHIGVCTNTDRIIYIPLNGYLNMD